MNERWLEMPRNYIFYARGYNIKDCALVDTLLVVPLDDILRTHQHFCMHENRNTRGCVEM